MMEFFLSGSLPLIVFVICYMLVIRQINFSLSLSLITGLGVRTLVTRRPLRMHHIALLVYVAYYVSSYVISYVKPSQAKQAKTSPEDVELSLLYQFWWACFLQP